MHSFISEIEKLITESRYFEAFQNVEAKLVENHNDERLQQLKALSLVKSGDAVDAMSYFEPVWRSHTNRSEAAGIMGSIYKSMFITTEDPKYGQLSAKTYTESFKAVPHYYTGINAATMSKITGDFRETKQLTQEVIDILIKEEDRDYWQEASLAEAYLLQKNIEKATEHYVLARKMLQSNWGDIASINRQLWLINHYTNVPNAIIKFFNPPVIATFIGHMIDAPDREDVRFSLSMEQDVRTAIRSHILSLEIQVGYCSIACGADILFIEEMLSLDRSVEIFLPFDKDDFVQTSVAFAGDGWVNRFEAILDKVQKINYLYEAPYSGDNYQFHLLSELLAGASILKAKLFDSKPILLAAISEFSLEQKTGGVRDFISFWPDKENIHRINIDNFKGSDSSFKLPTYNLLRPINDSGREINALSFVLTMESKHNFELSSEHLEYNSLVFKGVLGENKQVFIFTRLAAVLRFVKEAFFDQNLLAKKFKGSFVFGLIDNKNEKLSESNVIKDAFRLSELSGENSLLAIEETAFLLAMNTNNLDIDYAGQIGDDKNELKNIYRIGLN